MFSIILCSVAAFCVFSVGKELHSISSLNF